MSLPNWPEPLLRSAIFHLLWTQHLTLGPDAAVEPVAYTWRAGARAGRPYGPTIQQT